MAGSGAFLSNTADRTETSSRNPTTGCTSTGGIVPKDRSQEVGATEEVFLGTQEEEEGTCTRWYESVPEHIEIEGDAEGAALGPPASSCLC